MVGYTPSSRDRCIVPIAEYRDLAMNLNQRFEECNDLRIWAEAAAVRSEMPFWQHDLLSKLLSLQADIVYLTADFSSEFAWKVIAFTETNLIQVEIPPQRLDDRKRSTISVTSRNSIVKVEIVSIPMVPFESVNWPNQIEILLHTKDSVLKLPLDRYASRENRSELVAFYPSLLADLSKR